MSKVFTSKDWDKKEMQWLKEAMEKAGYKKEDIICGNGCGIGHEEDAPLAVIKLLIAKDLLQQFSGYIRSGGKDTLQIVKVTIIKTGEHTQIQETPHDLPEKITKILQTVTETPEKQDDTFLNNLMSMPEHNKRRW